jgi:hypothetical protein
MYKLRKDKFRIVRLQAKINYISCVSVLLLYVYFVVTSTVLLAVVFYLIGCKIGFGGPCIGLVLKGVNRYDGQ